MLAIRAVVQIHLQEQARIHFDCPDIRGVELENQGGASAFSHWEQRVLGVSYYNIVIMTILCRRQNACKGLKIIIKNITCFDLIPFQNEGMIALVLFTSPFSRITFGLMEDSGYVIPSIDNLYSYRVSSFAWSGISYTCRSVCSNKYWMACLAMLCTALKDMHAQLTYN